MSLSRACAYYGVTEKECQEAELPCQWRSAYGNCYAVVKVSDILDLKEKLKQQEQDKKKQALIAKHGEEGYERMQKKEADRKKQEADAAKAAEQAKRDEQKIVEQVTTLLSLAKEGSIGDDIPDITTVKISKSAAKSDFFLKDRDLDRLEGETTGRTTKYSVLDVIAKAQDSHNGNLLQKIQAKPKASRISHYAAYLKKKLDDDMNKLSKEVVDGAMAQVQRKLQDQVSESEKKLEAAEQELQTRENKVRTFHDVFHPDENSKPAPKKKKAKKTSA